ncbi:hypothetical protein ESZ50_05755 [Weissella muntiaci]|uniref:ImmA/IrrE family metallo-endopeptidase n=1 Tax=Weissella muntiaci TaxID=2508881 RepID=A0A6C2C6X2_9LACO|nr:hypothetical protein [Weissella muntiaci]TYC49648.1 hypothetical protein ESZ50_05755 [Weissella muntiaci]
MTRIDNLFSRFPEVIFIELHNCPDGFQGTHRAYKNYFYVYYNADLNEPTVYASILHELTHYTRGDVAYSEKNEYQTNIETSYDLVSINEVVDYNANNPELDDYAIAEHFNITIKQLHELVSAHYIKDGFTPPSGLLFSDYM